MTKRTTHLGAEALLGIEVPCLDHGFVQPIDYMGSDEDIVQAARVSYGPSTKPLQDDRSLLRYLMRHRHTTPFEMCEVKFRCRMPIFVARQWIRHRTANVNELSLRYSEAPDMFYVPRPEHVAAQSKNNRQGRAEQLSGEALQIALDLFTDGNHEDMTRYHRLATELGVARELARTVLPVSLYTQWIWKIDVHNLLHFLGLRLDPHAQLETRVYAEAMAGFVRVWLPTTWEAFEDYRLQALTFSRVEKSILAAVLWRARATDRAFADLAREAAAEACLGDREVAEFTAKFEQVLETMSKLRSWTRDGDGP